MSNIEQITAIYIPQGLSSHVKSIQGYLVDDRVWYTKSEYLQHFDEFQAKEGITLVGNTLTRVKKIRNNYGVDYVRSEINDTPADNLLQLPHAIPPGSDSKWSSYKLLVSPITFDTNREAL